MGAVSVTERNEMQAGRGRNRSERRPAAAHGPMTTRTHSCHFQTIVIPEFLMNLTKKILSTGALAVAMALAIGATPMTAAADPGLSIQQEEAAHPRLVHAIHEMREALHELEEAPNDFGGNKAAAIRDTKQAIHSLKRALYFRLKMDDAAIDRVQ